MSDNAQTPHRNVLHTGEPGERYMFANAGNALWTGVWLVIVIAWFYVAIMVLSLSTRAEFAELGPGMGVLGFLEEWIVLDPLARDILRSLCGPVAGLSGVDGVPGWGALDFLFVGAMWAAMVVAMMLPTAIPMIKAYAEIGETARAKRIRIVPTPVLILGYLCAWIGFCVVAVGGQWLLSEAVLMSPGLVLVHRGVAAAILVLAGIYQITPLKDACLTKCRSPLPFFLANWTDERSGVFKMGVQQGFMCIGCCWALMLVMFSVGLMNLLWMAALAVVMTMEKIVARPKVLLHTSGIVLIALGIFEMIITFTA